MPRVADGLDQQALPVPPGIGERVADRTGQRWDEWAATCAAGYTFQPVTGWQLDREQTIAWSRVVFAAFPDYREQTLHVHVHGPTVIAEVVGSGTHTGPFALPGKRSLAPTGAPFAVAYAKVLVLDDDGLVAQDRQYLDRLDLLDQLGAAQGARG